ncbi:MAG: glycosyltransferase family 2 protein [bacterium]|nr:glycosyltransferase family 2 protein [bacterium]
MDIKIVILPAYNEYENLKSLIPEIKKLKYKIVLIDDGSIDNTPTLKNDVEYYIKHEKNKGLGEALNTALRFISIFDSGIVVTMDADNSHPVNLIKEMEQKLTEFDVVIASRFKGGKMIGVGILRRILSKIASFVLRFRFNIKALDPTILYRAYRIEILKKVKPELPSTFVASFLLLKKISEITNKICEIPVVLRYDLKKGKSKMKLIKTMFEYLKILF